MDVTCERCGTEYEFDETLVSERGTTVKCTNCGHLFKVFRPDAAGGAKHWRVRSADGTVRTLSSLKELQRLITAGALSEDDRIARGDEDFKRLGDIAELATFFAAAAAATADTELGLDRAGRPRRGTSPGMAAAAPPRSPGGISPEATVPDPVHGAPAAGHAPPGGATRPPPRPRNKKSTLLGGHADETELDPPTLPDRAPPGARPRRPTPPLEPPGLAQTAPSTPAVPPRPLRPGAPPAPPSRPTPPRPAPPLPTAPTSAPPGPPPATRSQPPAPSAAPRGKALYLEESEPVAPPRGRSRSGLWVALVVLLAGAVGVALAWPQIAPLLGLVEPEESPANPHLESGDGALAQDTIGGYEQAVHHYTQALAYDEHDVTILTRLSRAHAAWAQALAFDASDLEARAEEDPASRGEAAAIRREERRHAETALARAEDAVRHGSGHAAAEVALADALRLTGDLTRGRSRLDRALTLEPSASPETLRVQALVAAAEAEGDLTAARPLAQQAVDAEPSLIRGRLLLARALLAAGEVAAARAQLDAVLEEHTRHERASALRDAIEEGRPPAPPTVAVPDGGVTEEPDGPPPTPEAPVETPGDDGTAEDPQPTASGRRRATGGGSDTAAAGSGPVPAGRDYGWYVRMGDERLERGDVARAGEFFDAARAIRPSGSEALTGTGYVQLEQGNASGAASRFRQAAGQGYAEAYIGLGSAYQRLGRLQDALTAYERYLERLPTGPRASVARRQAEELRRRIDASGGGGPATPDPDPGGGPSEGGGAEPDPDPTPDPGGLPLPRDTDQPPPQDVPAIDSEP